MDIGPVGFRDESNPETSFSMFINYMKMFTSQTLQGKILTEREGILMPCFVLYFLTTHCILIKCGINFSGDGKCSGYIQG